MSIKNISRLLKIDQYRLLDVLPFLVNFFIEKSRERFDTLLSRLLLSWWRVEFGQGLVFRGCPIIRRHPASQIIIGDRCKLNSAKWSNTIGLNRPCIISTARGAKIIIGDDSGLSGAVVAASKYIALGNRVLCGGNCTIVDNDRHPISLESRLRGDKVAGDAIIIEDDVFLGMNVFVLKGSHIGVGSVIAANSVVAGKIPANVIAAGSPAKVVRKLNCS